MYTHSYELFTTVGNVKNNGDRVIKKGTVKEFTVRLHSSVFSYYACAACIVDKLAFSTTDPPSAHHDRIRSCVTHVTAKYHGLVGEC